MNRTYDCSWCQLGPCEARTSTPPKTCLHGGHQQLPEWLERKEAAPKPLSEALGGPDSLKEGDWVYTSHTPVNAAPQDFCRVVHPGAMVLLQTCGTGQRWAEFEDVYPAHLREYTDLELRQQIGQTFVFADGAYMAIGCSVDYLIFPHMCKSREALLEATKLDGTPGGVLVKGKAPVYG